MNRITAILTDVHGRTDDTIELDFDHRNRRRIVLETRAGKRVLLDMPSAVHLRGGDRLQLEDGSIVAVEAADEPLLEIAAHDAAALVRIAWHLGNRHLPTQLLPGPRGGVLRIREDHVIEAMVIGLGASCRAVAAPFDPEGGAYATPAPAHAHGHHHDRAHHHHDHSHDAPH